MKPVKKLPSEVCSLVRSGVIIPTPSQAAVELVLNSIDAGATSIAVRVDLRIFKIQVVDNGHGITSKDLEEIGNRSVTSKCYTLDEYYTNLMYHGYRGESLASLREMCGLLEIVTRPADCNTTYSKVFLHGKEERVKISNLKRPTYGTTITITDFMFNMPVRRKRMKEAVELEAIRSCLECIALAHPEISLSIRNDVKGRIIMEKHKNSDLLNAFEHLFGHNLAQMLAAINFSTEKFKISGYIGKESYRHNDLQFIFVNRQPIIKTKLHKLVSALLSKSSIVRTNGPWKNKPIPKDVPIERWLSFSSLEKQKKFAVFVINITCARKEYERCWDAKMPLIYFKDWEGIIACVSNAIQEFLKLENLIDDDDDVEHVKSEDKAGNYISSIEGKPQSSHTSLSVENVSNVNHQKNIEVETWNIQGAIHGIYAKRPKESTMEFTGECVEGHDQEIESINEISRQFRSPGTINSSQECLQSEQESVPPVVEFLKKYETPAAYRLQITKGAYRLKQKEEEEKKQTVAKMLGTFKFPKKSKLTSSKNCENGQNGKLTCTKYAKKTKEPYFLSQKAKEQKYVKELNNKVDGPSISKSSDTLSLKTGKHYQLYSNSRHQNQVNACVTQKKSQIFMDSESSEDISNYFSLSPSSNIDTKTNTTLCISSDNFSFTSTEKVSSYENEDANAITLCSDSKRSLFQSPVDGSNVQVNDSFHQCFTKSVNPCKHPPYCDKSDGNVFSNDENVFVLEHGTYSSSSYVKDTQVVNNDISCVTENAKNCANLIVSKTLVLSIPTPQSKTIPVQTATSSEMVDKFHCSNKCSLRNQTILADSNENPYSSCKPPSSFVNVCKSPCRIDGHKSDSRTDELFACQEDNFSSFKGNLRKQNKSMVIPSSLVNNCVNKSQKSVECSHNVSDAEKIFMPSFAQENGTNDDWRVQGVEQVKTVKHMNVSNLKKDRNIRNVFETFEKPITPNITESVSPYFTIKNNLINYREPVKYNFNSERMSKTNDTDDSFRQNNKREDSDGLLSVSDVAGTEQHMELFTDVDKSKEFSDKGINVCPVVNFLFSGSSPKKNSKLCTKELEDASCIDISQTSLKKISSKSQSNVLTHCNEHRENFSHEIDVPKRRRLLPSKSEMESNGEDRLFADLKKTEEVVKDDTSFDSCVTSEREDMNACNQTDSVLPKEDLCQKKTENSIDKITDKDWLQVRNLKGEVFYFHTPSGFTTYHVPSIAKDASLYSMSKRCQFLPKGMSPLLATSTDFNSTSEQWSFPNVSADASCMIEISSNNDDLKTVKWRGKPDIFQNDISDMLSITEGPSDKKMSSNTSIPDLSSVASKMCTMILKQKLDKRIFSNIQVVGQLDNKFIITLCSEDKNSNPHILGIFDQHAAHERVRMEALMKAYSSSEDEWSFTATDLDEPIVLIVSSKELHVMSSFQNKFRKLGLHFCLIEDNVKIHKIPTCLYTRFLRERSSQWLEEILHILIQDVVLFLIKTGGQDLVVPEVFKDVINSEACKGAIKFGDPLSVVECESLLLDLSKCDLPFYCAHGRPSFMPLFDLKEYEEERRKHIQGY